MSVNRGAIVRADVDVDADDLAPSGFRIERDARCCRLAIVEQRQHRALMTSEPPCAIPVSMIKSGRHVQISSWMA